MELATHIQLLKNKSQELGAALLSAGNNPALQQHLTHEINVINMEINQRVQELQQVQNVGYNQNNSYYQNGDYNQNNSYYQNGNYNQNGQPRPYEPANIGVSHNNGNTGIGTNINAASKYNHGSIKKTPTPYTNSGVVNQNIIEVNETLQPEAPMTEVIKNLTPLGITQTIITANDGSTTYQNKGKNMEEVIEDNMVMGFNNTTENVVMVMLVNDCLDNSELHMHCRNLALTNDKPIVVTDVLYYQIHLTDKPYDIHRSKTVSELCGTIKSMLTSGSKKDTTTGYKINRTHTKNINLILATAKKYGYIQDDVLIDSFYEDYEELTDVYLSNDATGGMTDIKQMITNVIKPYMVPEQNIGEDISEPGTDTVYSIYTALYIEDKNISVNIKESLDNDTLAMTLTRDSHNELFRLLSSLHNNDKLAFNSNHNLRLLIQNGDTYNVMYSRYKDEFVIFNNIYR